MSTINSPANNPSDSNPVYDLIVVGSGFAIPRSRERPRKSSHSGRWTPAFFRLDKNNKFDSDFKNEMKAYCEKLEAEVPNTVKFLLDLQYQDERNVYLGFNTGQNFAKGEGGGHAIILKLFKHILSFPNVDIMWETNAEQLLTQDDGTICGVKVRKNDGHFAKVFGEQVMLSCGGFEGNREMPYGRLGRYVGPRAEQLGLVAPGLKYNTGFGLKMGLQVGAATAGSFHGLHCELVDTRSSKPEATVWGHSFGIVVNEQSKRFYDEGNRSLFATCEVIAYETWRDQRQKAYFITDAPIMDRFRPGWVYDTTDLDPEKGDTIEDLAVKLGLVPQALKKTVDEYNASINGKEFNPMILDGKSTFGLTPNKTNWAAPIKVAPFYGYPLTAKIVFTFGGLKDFTAPVNSAGCIKMRVRLPENLTPSVNRQRSTMLSDVLHSVDLPENLPHEILSLGEPIEGIEVRDF
ncbi:succinate dehydrogenase/fumarate reductase flavo protein [Aspergillus ellipticus CBS 707.79]|uniref:Succinate dehydrogenase/fumarate reductase flavo protein n=1 Tax=Aspergillus ellipticus CBS 707.79 TaxID=1448320 RepID=A0A319D3T4_9EURO|nr:succinate dehydrogenase/fumarate reductase flavo protein [Aspergillus ellipticus CBS 707.79]